ncbi:MAG: NAD(P)/FAD-dependent oxidoreductase [Candidatus Nezhaarchaeales archaeon]
MRYVDVAVIGGGPSGLSAAWSAASHGLDVAVFEEHEEVGRPRHCAGLVSGEGLKLIGMPCKNEYVENKVDKAIIAIDNFCFEVRKVGEPIYVLNREVFDKAMADRATDRGAKILLGSQVKKVEIKDEGYIVKTRQSSYLCKIVIDGEGAVSRLASAMGLRGPMLKMPALQVEYKVKAPLENEVFVILGDEWAPGFFSWAIPTGDHGLRIGLAAVSGNCSALLKRITKRHPLMSKILRDGIVSRIYGGTIVIGPPERTHIGNFMVVGDAAGQTKPLTGGGVVYGALCGSLAGIIASKVIDGKADATLYERIWRRILGLEEKLGLLLRKTLINNDFGKLLRLVSRTSILSHVERNFHYEYHVSSIVKRPGILILSSLLLALLSPGKAFKYFLQVTLPKRRRSKIV